MKTNNGYNTRQRQLIWEYLREHPGQHVGVDDVVQYLAAKQSPVGRATVYRYLDRLVEEGAVRRYHLGANAGACYEFIPEPGHCSAHFHLKCTKCGKLEHVECKQLMEIADHVAQEHGFSIDQTKTVFYGICNHCTPGKGER